MPGVVVDACEAEWGGGTVAGGAGRVGVEVALEGDDDADGAGVAGEVQVVVGLGVGVAGCCFGVVGGLFGERHCAFGDASEHGELAGFALGLGFGGWVGRGHGRQGTYSFYDSKLAVALREDDGPDEPGYDGFGGLARLDAFGLWLHPHPVPLPPAGEGDGGGAWVFCVRRRRGSSGHAGG